MKKKVLTPAAGLIGVHKLLPRWPQVLMYAEKIEIKMLGAEIRRGRIIWKYQHAEVLVLLVTEQIHIGILKRT